MAIRDSYRQGERWLLRIREQDFSGEATKVKEAHPCPGQISGTMLGINGCYVGNLIVQPLSYHYVTSPDAIRCI